MDDNYTGLVIEDGFSKKPCQLLTVDVNLKICNNIANVNAQLVYKNESKIASNATFIFPLDYRCAVYYFKASTRGKDLIAVCKEKSNAQEIYSLVEDSGETVGLLLEGSDNAFQLAIGNIPPEEETIITLKYIQPLDIEKKIFGDFNEPRTLIQYCLPTTLCPKQEKKSENKVPYSFSFEANMNMSLPVESVESSNYQFDLSFIGNDRRCSNLKLISDLDFEHDLQFIIIMNDDKKEKMDFGIFIEKGLVLNEDKNTLIGSHILSAIISPPLIESVQESKNEIVFIIDRSGSMQGDRMDHAKQTLMLFLKSLPLNCKFQIIGFGTEANKLFDGLVDYNEENMKKAVAYQNEMTADMGGTEVKEALKLVYELGDIQKGWDRQIIFLTDGDVDDIGQVVSFAKINELKGRIFSIGLGDGAGVSLCYGLANATGGNANFIRESQKLRSVVMDILANCLNPRAINISLEWKLDNAKAGKIENYPEKIISVFSGRAIAVFGIYNGDFDNLRGSVTLKYSLRDKDFSITQPFNIEKNGLSMHLRSDQIFHKLVARMKIETMTALYDIGETNQIPKKELEEYKDKVIKLSIEHNVLSRFTGMITVDPEVSLENLGLKILKGESQGLIQTSSNNMNVTAAAPMEPFEFDPFAEDNESSGPKKSEADLILKLAETQNFDGSWTLEDKKFLELIEIYLSLKKDDLLKEKPKTLSDNNWATCLCIAIMGAMPNLEAEWKLIHTKALELIKNEMDHLNLAKSIIEKNISFK